MRLFVLNLLVAFVWPLLIGSLTITDLLFGFIVGYLVLYSLKGMLEPTEYFRKLPLTISFVVYFFWELVLANIRIAWEVVTPKPYRRPGIVAVPLDVKTDGEITLLACVITLTPGSMAIDISKDRKTMYIHAMFIDDVEEFKASIKNGFEKRVLELLR